MPQHRLLIFALCILGTHHHNMWGPLAIIDPAIATDGKAAVLRTWPGSVRERRYRLRRRIEGENRDAIRQGRHRLDGEGVAACAAQPLARSGGGSR